MSTQANAERIVALTKTFQSVAVAFSAGVDSTVVAKAAQLSLGPQAIAFTADSPSLAREELHQAIELAEIIGIRHEVLRTKEVSDPDYAANRSDRCYHCKSHLYEALHQVAGDYGFRIIINGTNTDDLGDYRPGLRAAVEFEVRSPLVECGLNKQQVRALAAYWELPVWDKPAMPCLASRIAYGCEVTASRLRMVELAEEALRKHDLTEFRVRYHEGDVARLEVSLDQLTRLSQAPLREQIVSALRNIGFRFVALDLEGFRSGSLNSLVPLETLKQSIRQPKS